MKSVLFPLGWSNRPVAACVLAPIEVFIHVRLKYTAAQERLSPLQQSCGILFILQPFFFITGNVYVYCEIFCIFHAVYCNEVAL